MVGLLWAGKMYDCGRERCAPRVDAGAAGCHRRLEVRRTPQRGRGVRRSTAKVLILDSQSVITHVLSGLYPVFYGICPDDGPCTVTRAWNLWDCPLGLFVLLYTGGSTKCKPVNKGAISTSQYKGALYWRKY